MLPENNMAVSLPAAIKDPMGRSLRDLRLSVTDRCNFRCTYCMPKEVFGPDHAFLPRNEILSFEELTRLTRVFVGLGVRKVRLTGGEPLLRRELPELIRQLSAIKDLDDIALTTNGSALVQLAKPLRDAGLRRLTVSLDALDDSVFRAMNDVDFPVHRVLCAIDAAVEAGFAPVKINMVVKRGLNDHEILPMARRFSGPQFILRYIEYMDVGNTNGWRMDDVVSAREIISVLQEEFPLQPLLPNYEGEVARRFRHQDGGGEIGVIASVTQPFCRGCTRARVSSNGEFFTCLFASEGHDLRALLRSEKSDEGITQTIRSIWQGRGDRYSELRSAATGPQPKAEMSVLGG